MIIEPSIDPLLLVVGFLIDKEPWLYYSLLLL